MDNATLEQFIAAQLNAVKAVRAASDALRSARHQVDQGYKQIAEWVGPLAVGCLVSDLTRKRLFEITSINQYPDSKYPYWYSLIGISIVTGDQLSRRCWGMIAGSLIPVPPTHPVYPKWAAHKLRRRCEGAKG